MNECISPSCLGVAVFSLESLWRTDLIEMGLPVVPKLEYIQ